LISDSALKVWGLIAGYTKCSYSGEIVREIPVLLFLGVPDCAIRDPSLSLYALTPEQNPGPVPVPAPGPVQESGPGPASVLELAPPLLRGSFNGIGPGMTCPVSLISETFEEGLI